MASVDSLYDFLREAGVPDKLMDRTLDKLDDEDVVDVRDLSLLRTLSGGLGELFPKLTASRIERALDAFDESPRWRPRSRRNGLGPASPPPCAL